MPRSRRRAQPSPTRETTQQTTQNSTQTDTQNGLHDIDSTDSETEVIIDSNSKSKPKLQIFKGIGDKVTIENWIKRFEMLAVHYKWSDKSKIVMLGNYLEDDALNWYIESYLDDNFAEMKLKLRVN